MTHFIRIRNPRGCTGEYLGTLSSTLECVRQGTVSEPQTMNQKKSLIKMIRLISSYQFFRGRCLLNTLLFAVSFVLVIYVVSLQTSDKKMPLKEYQDIVGSTAAVVTIAQFFSPVFICKKIISQGNTENVASTPFVGGIGLGLLFLRHGFILNDPAMVPVNVAALVLNGIYLLIFLAYTDDKASVIKGLAKVLVGASVILLYSFIDTDQSSLEFYYGVIVTTLMFALIGAPLKNLGEIIKTQDTGSLPFPMILSGTVVTALWLLYGIILENNFIIAQNLVGMTLSGIQLSLFVIYPSKSTKKAD